MPDIDSCAEHAGENIQWTCSVCGAALCPRCGPVKWEGSIFCGPCAKKREAALRIKDARARRRATAAEALKAGSVIFIFVLLVFLAGKGCRALGNYRLSARYASDLPLAADFSFADARGRTISLSSLRGKVVILDFWAGWCEPCLRLIPDLKGLNSEFSGRPFLLVGVNLDKTKGEFKAATDEHGVDWLQVWNDPKGRPPIAKLYGVSQIPATVIIDKKGRIFKRWSLWDGKMSSYVRFLLAQPSY